MEKNKVVGIIVALAIVVGLVIGGIILLGPQKKVLKVFHAGSLTVPFESVEDKFEADNPNIDVQLEAAGSVQCVTKITEVGEVADVLASADWKLIPSMPSEYQDYYIKFAVNRMVLAYTNQSKYKDTITASNFYDILSNSDLKWGFSDPNLDPCGYRSLMVLQLAELKYGDSNILEDLVLEHSDITVNTDGTNYNITTPDPLGIDTDSNLVIREKSVDLVTLLKEGGLDYAFEYQSVAEQHDLEFVQLDTAIDLSDANLDLTYARVKVIKTSGVSTGKSITYGITVPKNANNPSLGAQFIEYVINEEGKEIFTNLGQPPLDPCITNDVTLLPSNLQPYCVSES
ncbi:MAG: putative solute-binding protein [Promethearchaeota archaeon]|nr:MAG: putative solute-binding protein [Candidatus Lokiarchaeota archaeon]